MSLKDLSLIPDSVINKYGEEITNPVTKAIFDLGISPDEVVRRIIGSEHGRKYLEFWNLGNEKEQWFTVSDKSDGWGGLNPAAGMIKAVDYHRNVVEPIRIDPHYMSREHAQRVCDELNEVTRQMFRTMAMYAYTLFEKEIMEGEGTDAV